MNTLRGNEPLEDTGLTVRSFTMTRSLRPKVVRRRILLAAGDQEMRAALNHVLDRTGYDVVCCYEGGAAASLLRTAIADEQTAGVFDLFLCDARLLDNQTVGELARLQKHRRFPPLVLITAFSGAEAVARAARLRTSGVLDNGFDLRRQLALVRRLAPYRASDGNPDISNVPSNPSAKTNRTATT